MASPATTSIEIGSHGIALIAGGDRVTLTPANNYADNNYIHHTGVFYKQGVGISMTGWAARLPQPDSRHAAHGHQVQRQQSADRVQPHAAHVNLETEDTGVVYTGGRDWISSRGTVIRYNYMHDSIGFGQENGKWVSPHFSWGVYLDDNTGGVDVIGNIVVRAYRGLIHLHNGRDNLIENNIFVDGKLQQAEFDGWTDTSRMWLDHFPTMVEGLRLGEGSAGMEGHAQHRDVAATQAVLPGGLIMSGNVFRRNIVYWRDPAAKLFQQPQPAARPQPVGRESVLARRDCR